MMVRFPGESAAYRAARDELLERERELRREMEAVAAARRALPPGGVVPEDYAFTAGTGERVRLSELFGAHDTLVVYSMMFPRHPSDDRPGACCGATAALALEESPCPSCAALVDQLDGAAEHAGQHVGLVVVAKAPFERVRDFAAERGWQRLRVLSCAGTTYNRDYLGEDDGGAQQPMLNVFVREGDTIRHFWGSELCYAPAEPSQDSRHVGTIEPVWNIFDLTPAGRGRGWDEQLHYG
jgi:predicted dithiol-disulfide oxidoreductase (DUF899 family)